MNVTFSALSISGVKNMELKNRVGLEGQGRIQGQNQIAKGIPKICIYGFFVRLVFLKYYTFGSPCGNLKNHI